MTPLGTFGSRLQCDARAVLRRGGFLLALATLGCGGKTLIEEPPADASPSDGAVTDGGADFTRCTGPGTCTLARKTCCDTCDAVNLETRVGIARSSYDAYLAGLCTGATGCPPIACDRIAEPNVQAWCRPSADGSRCAAVDVRSESISACTTDADCMLRYDECCEPCEERFERVIALNRTSGALYREMVCTGTEICARCLAPYPAGTIAVCDPSTKHCRVQGAPR